jgi:hypothetical protein
LNDEEGPVIPQLVSNDLRNIASHPNIMTACLVWAREDTKAQRASKVNSTLDWRDLEDEAILQLYGGDGSNFTREELGFDYLEAHGFWEPCSVIKEEDSGRYTVRVLSKLGKNEESRPDFLTNYPRESIRYFLKPYKSDLHLPNAFRHHIEISDEIFPEKWKDLKDKKNRFKQFFGLCTRKLALPWRKRS